MYEGKRGRYFCCVGGVGLDVEVARRANQLPRALRRRGGYLFSVLPALFGFQPVAVKVSSNDDPSGELDIRHDGPAMLVAFANTPTYGGGVLIAPRAQLDDGKLDVCVVGSMAKARLLRLFPRRLFRPPFEDLPEVRYFQADRLRIETEKPSEVYADGEYVCSTPVEVTVERAALKVIVPAPRSKEKRRTRSPPVSGFRVQASSPGPSLALLPDTSRGHRSPGACCTPGTIQRGRVIDHDVIAVPQPVGAGIVIVGRRLKKESADVEAVAIAAMQPPNMLRPNRSGEASMLPGMIEMIVNVVPSRVVSDPAIVFRVNVRRGRMPGASWKVRRCSPCGGLRLQFSRAPRRSSGGSRAVLRNVPAAHSLLMCHARLWGAAVRLASWLSCPFLRPQHGGQKHDQQRGRKAAAFLHTASFSPRSRLLLYRPLEVLEDLHARWSWIAEVTSCADSCGARPSWRQCVFPGFQAFSHPRSPAHIPSDE